MAAGDVNDGPDGGGAAGLEGYVLESHGGDVLGRHVGRRNAAADGEAGDGEALGAQVAQQWDLPGQGARVDVDDVDGDGAAGGHQVAQAG